MNYRYLFKILEDPIMKKWQNVYYISLSYWNGMNSFLTTKHFLILNFINVVKNRTLNSNKINIYSATFQVSTIIHFLITAKYENRHTRNQADIQCGKNLNFKSSSNFNLTFQ